MIPRCIVPFRRGRCVLRMPKRRPSRKDDPHLSGVSSSLRPCRRCLLACFLFDAAAVGGMSMAPGDVGVGQHGRLPDKRSSIRSTTTCVSRLGRSQELRYGNCDLDPEQFNMATVRYDEIGYWSELKLEIVRKYATAYSGIL